MSGTTTISKRFQIAIPKEIRDEMHWEAGQELVFLPKGHGVMIMAAPRIEELFGVLKDADPTGYRDRDDRY